MPSDTDTVRILLILVGVVVLAPFLMVLIAWPMMGMGGGGHMWADGMGGGMGATGGWFVMCLVLLAVLLGGGYLLFRAVTQRDDDNGDDAMAELRLAYARGELSDEEFESRRERLQRTGG